MNEISQKKKKKKKVALVKQNFIEVLPLDRRSRRDLRYGYFVHGHHMSGVVVFALGSVAAQRAPKP
jgi:hypothetical protein